jgi:hypothetical protein
MRFQGRSWVGLYKTLALVFCVTIVSTLAFNVRAAQAENPCDVIDHNDITPTTPWAHLDSDVTLVLRELNQCIKQGHREADLRVFLNGKVLQSVSPIPAPDGQSYVKFRLRVNTSDKEERARWADIITDARRSDGGVLFTLGDGKKLEPFASQQVIKLILYPWFSPLLVAGLALLLACILYLAARSNLLRDNPTSTLNANANYPVSLGRVQMAWWFYLVIAAYLYLWLLTGQSSTPTGSVLTLIGISTATGFAGAIIDRQKTSDAVTARAELDVQQTTLHNRITEIEAAHPTAGSDLERELSSKRDQLQESRARIAKTPAVQPSTSGGWLKDLFCDGDGVSFHRFQIIVWSIVLGIVFINAVHRDLAMPDFDAALLGLMGISSGAYVGFKFPEKPKA